MESEIGIKTTRLMAVRNPSRGVYTKSGSSFCIPIQKCGELAPETPTPEREIASITRKISSKAV